MTPFLPLRLSIHGFRRTSRCRSHAKKAALQKFRKSGADPAFAERWTARMASANTRSTVKSVREN
jgi:hypothetical protein